jgi:hypothetical protein
MAPHSAPDEAARSGRPWEVGEHQLSDSPYRLSKLHLPLADQLSLLSKPNHLVCHKRLDGPNRFERRLLRCAPTVFKNPSPAAG